MSGSGSGRHCRMVSSQLSGEAVIYWGGAVEENADGAWETGEKRSKWTGKKGKKGKRNFEQKRDCFSFHRVYLSNYLIQISMFNHSLLSVQSVAYIPSVFYQSVASMFNHSLLSIQCCIRCFISRFYLFNQSLLSLFNVISDDLLLKLFLFCNIFCFFHSNYLFDWFDDYNFICLKHWWNEYGMSLV